MPTIDDLRPCHPMSDATPEPTPVENVALECYQIVYNTSRLVRQLASAKDIAETEADACLEAVGALLSPCADRLLELYSALSAAERARKKGGTHDDRD
jgi:hypothetical protein